MKIGLALSGGGIRGIAHAGALKALEDNKIPIDVIGGTSSGALISSLYALGYSPYYIYVLFKRYAKDIAKMNSAPILSGIGNMMMNKKVKLTGLKTGRSIEKAYNGLAKKKGIEKIGDIKNIPIVIPTVDIVNAKEYIFTNKVPEGEEENDKYITNISLGKAVRASSSFPAVFCPCKYQQHQFLDGGMLDNIPVTEVRKQGANKVIAINFKADDIDNSSNIMDLAMRTLDIMGNKLSANSLQKSDFLLTIPTDGTGLIDIDKMDKCYNLGYQTTKENIDKIKRIIE